MPKKEKYTKTVLEQIVASSVSMAEVLRNLGLKITGGSYYHISRKIKSFGINYSHFSGAAWNRGKRNLSRHTIESAFKNNSAMSSSRIHKLLAKFGLAASHCYGCGLSHWKGHSIPLDAHHIDGDSSNNLLSNISMLCPNCHRLAHQQKIKDIISVDTMRDRSKGKTVVS